MAYSARRRTRTNAGTAQSAGKCARDLAILGAIKEAGKDGTSRREIMRALDWTGAETHRALQMLRYKLLARTGAVGTGLHWFLTGLGLKYLAKGGRP